MLWAAVLPFQITCVLIVAGYTAFVVAAPKWKMERGHAAVLGVGVAVVGFIPLCLGLDAVISPVRFGIFHYDSPAEMGDGHADRRLPPAAWAITIDQYSAGFRARYKIEREDFDAWLDDEWEQAAAGYTQMDGWDPPERRPTEPADADSFNRRFSKYGWTMPTDALRLHAPYAPNGGGSELWYSASESRAYQAAGYW